MDSVVKSAGERGRKDTEGEEGEEEKRTTDPFVENLYKLGLLLGSL